MNGTGEACLASTVNLGMFLEKRSRNYGRSLD